MAIYSLHHSPVGKSTQAQPYTAAAHIAYITRKSAMSQMRFERVPAATPRQMAAYLRECEDLDRKNARVIDKLMIALPRELTAEQRVELVRSFAEDVTEGRAPWLAAFHDKGKDRQNPHCHLVLRDRDFETGKRVVGTSEVGSTERLRQKWEEHANKALERAGCRERIDRRSLKARGIERQPTIHEGPQAQAMDKRGARPESKRRRLRNRPGSRHSHRTVDYKSIDKGVSRPQENRWRRQDRQETEKDLWEAIDRHNFIQEMAALSAIHKGSLVDGVPILFRGAVKRPASPKPAHSLLRNGVLRFIREKSRKRSVPNRANGIHQPVDTPPKPTHTQTIPLSLNTKRKSGMQDLKRRRLLEQRHDEAQQRFEASHGYFKQLVGLAYSKPDEALKNMSNHAAKHGEGEVIALLRSNPEVFGVHHSEAGTWQSLKRDARERERVAKLALQELPGALSATDWHSKTARDAQQQLRDEGFWPRPPVKSPKSIASRSRPQMATAPTSEPQHTSPRRDGAGQSRDTKNAKHKPSFSESLRSGRSSPPAMPKPQQEIPSVRQPSTPRKQPAPESKSLSPKQSAASPVERPSFSEKLRSAPRETQKAPKASKREMERER